MRLEALHLDLAGAPVLRILQSPVPQPVRLPLHVQIRIDQHQPRDHGLLFPHAFQRKGERDFPRGEERDLVRPRRILDVYVTQPYGWFERKPELDMQVADSDFAMRPLNEITFERMAKPVPVEQRDHDAQRDRDAKQYRDRAAELGEFD